MSVLPAAGQWLMKHLCLRETACQAPTTPFPPSSFSFQSPAELALIPAAAEAPPPHGTGMGVCPPPPRISPCMSPMHEAPRISPCVDLPARGWLSHVSLSFPPPLPRAGLPAAKCPLSIKRQTRDFRGRLFEAEMLLSSAFWKHKYSRKRQGQRQGQREDRQCPVGCTHSHTYNHTDTHTGQEGREGPDFPVPAGGTWRGSGLSVRVLGRSLAPELGITTVARGCRLRLPPCPPNHHLPDNIRDIQTKIPLSPGKGGTPGARGRQSPTY